MNHIDLASVAERALSNIDSVIEWLELDGKLHGHEFISFGPTHFDGELGSFCINVETGYWAGLAGDENGCGDDVISLVAYVMGVSPMAAAAHLERFLDDLDGIFYFYE